MKTKTILIILVVGAVAALVLMLLGSQQTPTPLGRKSGGNSGGGSSSSGTDMNDPELVALLATMIEWNITDYEYVQQANAAAINNGWDTETQMVFDAMKDLEGQGWTIAGFPNDFPRQWGGFGYATAYTG